MESSYLLIAQRHRTIIDGVAYPLQFCLHLFVLSRYFVSGGFATIKADSSTIVNAVEAVKFEDLDAGLARKGLDDANAALAKAVTEQDKAAAQVAIEVNEAIIQALEAK